MLTFFDALLLFLHTRTQEYNATFFDDTFMRWRSLDRRQRRQRCSDSKKPLKALKKRKHHAPCTTEDWFWTDFEMSKVDSEPEASSAWCTVASKRVSSSERQKVHLRSSSDWINDVGTIESSHTHAHTHHVHSLTVQYRRMTIAKYVGRSKIAVAKLLSSICISVGTHRHQNFKTNRKKLNEDESTRWTHTKTRDLALM